MDSRTPSGAPSAAERKKTGGGHGLKPGSYPVFDTKSGEDALSLRDHANPEAVIAKVADFANRTGNAQLIADVKKAREAQNK